MRSSDTTLSFSIPLSHLQLEFRFSIVTMHVRSVLIFSFSTEARLIEKSARLRWAHSAASKEERTRNVIRYSNS